MMKFNEALAHKARLEKDVKEASDFLKSAFPQKTAMRMTPDYVKADPYHKHVKKAYDIAFSRLQSFNAWFVKKYKTEIQEMRRDKNESS